MPKIVTNSEFIQAALKGARYADGSPVKKYVPKPIEPEPEIEPPQPVQPVVNVTQESVDMTPVIEAIEGLKSAMPQPRKPMKYAFTVTGRDASGRILTFTATESPA